MSEKKQEHEELSGVSEPILAQDREASLANGFDDHGIIEELTSTTATPSLMEETVSAVQDLVAEATPMELPYSDPNSELTLRCEMFEKFFGLILSEHQFTNLVENILSALMHVVGAEVGSIFELDNERNEFFFRCSYGGGDPESLHAFRVPYGQGIVGDVAETKQARLVQSDQSDANRSTAAIGMLTGFTPKSCIAVPIIVADKLYGVVELFNKTGVEYFDDRDLQTVQYGVQFAAKVLETRFFAAEMLRLQKAKNQSEG